MIETARLILRDWREGDIEPFIAATNTPAVMKYLGGVRSVERMRVVCRDRFMRWQEDFGYTLWIAERREDRRLLGCCGLRPVEIPGEEGAVELALRLIPEVWGAGYAIEGCRASVAHAFSEIKAPKVLAFHLPQNRGSRLLAHQLGMSRAEPLDRDGAVCWAIEASSHHGT